MQLLKLFQHRSRAFYFFIALLGLISSLTNLGILTFINASLGGKPFFLFPSHSYLVFIGLLLVSFFTNMLFQHYLVVLTNETLFGMELSLVQKVRHCSYESFMGMGTERIYAAIADTRILSRVPEIFVTVINAFVTILCGVGYLCWLSPWGGVTIIVLMTLLLLFYVSRNSAIEGDMNKVRDLQDKYYNSLRELLDGFRQIRISARRNNNLYNQHILANRKQAKGLSILTSRKYVVNELIGTYSWYIVLGVIMFVLPLISKMDLLLTGTFIATVLFMMSAVTQLILFFPFYTTVKIATERIDRIHQRLVPVDTPLEEPLLPPVTSIRFENVCYRYRNEDDQSFTMEDLNVQISQGELLFIIGGNGSGKSTFIDILTGICKPQSGKVYVNEEYLSWEAFAQWSNQMALVYSQHHLFKANYDEFDISDNNPAYQQYLKMLHLDKVVRPAETGDWIDHRLSRGQQKRLALLFSLLENKPLLILDEWAAEQDPYNRKTFYTQWLQEMRKMGKTIVLVSHDDDFYDMADRIIKFDYGRIVSETTAVNTVK